MTLSVIILAAGKGTRMRSSRPKVLQPLAGRPMLSYLFETVARLNPVEVFCVVGSDAQAIQTAFSGAPCQFVTQDEPLGTAHAVLQAMPHVKGERVLVLSGDGPLIAAGTLLRFLESMPKDVLGVLTYEHPDPSGLGRIVRRSDCSIERIVEEKDTTPEERAIVEVSSGIFIARQCDWAVWLPQVGKANRAGEYYLPDVVPLAASSDIKVQAMCLADPFEAFGINDMEQLSQAERFMQTKQAEALMAQGVRFADPARFDLRGTLTVEEDVFIDVNVIIEGNVSLGKGTQIGANVIIKNSVIGKNVHILPFTHIDGAQIGNNATVGPFARIRPNTQLAEDVHIGNFVEVKNSTIGKASKANHLSYVGDAHVSEHVNIGAGVVTCNYDGVNKHRTEIEKEAFIGSNVSLVAPVTIGEGATIGAGTVLTKDAPPQQLTVARAKQTTISNWQRPEKNNKGDR